MSDIAEKLLKAIRDRQAKAEEASTHTLDEMGVLEMELESMEWRVVSRDGHAWLEDRAGEAVALASDVNRVDETWEPIPYGRLAFMADNDPASVRRRCAADREIVALHKPVEDGMGYIDGDYGAIEPACATCGTSDEYAVLWPCATVSGLARGYGIQP